jgi:hypothetical protein
LSAYSSFALLEGTATIEPHATTKQVVALDVTAAIKPLATIKQVAAPETTALLERTT